MGRDRRLRCGCRLRCLSPRSPRRPEVVLRGGVLHPLAWRNRATPSARALTASIWGECPSAIVPRRHLKVPDFVLWRPPAASGGARVRSTSPLDQEERPVIDPWSRRTFLTRGAAIAAAATVSP